MPIPKIATLLGGLLLSPGARRMAGRHAGKLTLATLAWQLWQQRQTPAGKAGATPPPHARKRWSGRRV